ncbi:hypothetical protein VTJ83DRAFT_6076 [Remersonia thermophila]|uniref:Uncharacterized protein n=1 Tax=Remersonia thermophila TaxID=72144 RepID=A0ABR4D8N2_9PEZI
MIHSLRLAAACFAVFGPDPSAGLDAGLLKPSLAAARRNAFNVFNAIHSATRQWGSSLRHNGMSVFLATVPAGVLLHHGTPHLDPPPGPEWLAFEIEHAELFAHPRPPRRPPPPPEQDLGGGRFPGSPQRPLHHRRTRPPPPPRVLARQDVLGGGGGPEPPLLLNPPPGPGADEVLGYLHTYRTTAPLSLLYLDGSSAGKTDMGTLDTQDLLLRGNRSAFVWDEGRRAQGLCDIVTSWGLHGVIRMEAGFEIIKCAPFLSHMELASVSQRPGIGDDAPWKSRRDVRMFETIRAVARRYWGIGAGRIVLDWGSMVSGYFYDVDLGLGDQSQAAALPRLTRLTDSELKDIRRSVKEMAGERGPASTGRSDAGGKRGAVDWQGVVDLVVARYAERLRYMAEGVETVEGIEDEVGSLLDTHIDYAAQDEGYAAAAKRCAGFYTQGLTPETQGDRLVLAAIETVAERICSTLFHVRQLVLERPEGGDGEMLKNVKDILQRLMKRLAWTNWMDCRGCGIDEVCFLPMWPYGDRPSHEQPNCRNATTLQTGWLEDGYWKPGIPGGPRAGRPPP